MVEKLEFHFKGGVADNQQLPVDCMLDLLSNIKELTYLVVAQSLGIAYNERFKPSKEIKDNYMIKCEIPQEGSYAMPVSIEYVGQELPLAPINPGEKIHNMMEWIVAANEPEIVHLFPNPKMRSRALNCVRAALPRSDSGIYVEMAANDNMAAAINSKAVQKNITAIIDRTQNVVEEYMTVVTGRLVSIEFDEKKIVIHHPMINRQLECFYNEEIEDMLLDNRRQLVQITGSVVLDDNDWPKKITDVVNIQEIDLSPIDIDDINCEGRKLHLKNTLTLIPELDDTKQLYTIRCQDLGLEAFAYTRQELTEDIKEDICYLWEEYALADDDTLSNDAKELKAKLLAAIEEVM